MLRQDVRMLVLAIGLGISVLLLTCPARSAEIGMVQTTGTVTCDESVEDGIAVVLRVKQLQEMLDKTESKSGKLVVSTEIAALKSLAVRIHYWRNENCRGA